MKKLLSVLMVASMVSFVACKGGKKNDDAAKATQDSLDKIHQEDSIKNAMVTPVDTAAKVDTAATKEAPKKDEMHKDEKHK